MRRPNGSGSIYKVKGLRKPWKAVKTIGREYGVLQRKVVGYFATRREAEEAIATANVTEWYNATVREIYNAYIDFRTKQRPNHSPLSQHTLNGYNLGFSKWTELHDKSLRSVTIDELQDVLDELVEDRKSRSLISKTRSCMTQIYKFGVPRGAAPEDLTQYIILRTPKDKPTVRFSSDEIATLWHNKSMPNMDIILCMIYTATRPSELIIADISQLDIKNKILITGTKTEASSNRPIPIHDSIMPFFINRIGKRTSGKIFLRPDGKEIHRVYFNDYILKPIVKHFNMNPELTGRSCRKTGLSIMAEANLSDLERKKIAGHTDIKLTDKIYTELEYKRLHEAIEKIKIN